MGVWVSGVALYLLIAGLPQLGWSGVAPWLGATIPTYAFGLITYALVGRSAERATASGATEHGTRR
jgi:hypothetical protein